MRKFYNKPIYNTHSDKKIDGLVILECDKIDINQITKSLAENELILIRSFSFEKSTALFSDLVDYYGLRNSYDIQMQYVVHMMMDRTAIDDVAVTVNSRGPFQIIQSHSEGDSTSQLELFGLFCKKNAETGGHNILSLINQSADFSKLSAKEKVIIGENLSEAEINQLRGRHMDANTIASNSSPTDKVLFKSLNGKVVVRNVPIKPSKSIISNKNLYTFWDNITVHDHAFHKYHFALLKELEILCEIPNSNYETYMHVEEDSDWAPANTNSGSLLETANLFDKHVVHKMKSDDFLIFNNRAWTHGVNNWPPGEERQLFAMYS